MVQTTIIKKIAKDIQTVRFIHMLWDTYKHDMGQFGKKLGDFIKRFGLSFSHDGPWILQELKKVTGEDWHISAHDFKIAKKLKKN